MNKENKTAKVFFTQRITDENTNVLEIENVDGIEHRDAGWVTAWKEDGSRVTMSSHHVLFIKVDPLDDLDAGWRGEI